MFTLRTEPKIITFTARYCPTAPRSSQALKVTIVILKLLTLLLRYKPYKDTTNRIKHDLSYANAIQKSIIPYIEC